MRVGPVVALGGAVTVGVIGAAVYLVSNGHITFISRERSWNDHSSQGQAGVQANPKEGDAVKAIMAASVDLKGRSLPNGVPVEQLVQVLHLVRLDVSGCNLTQLPSSISRLETLQALLAARNQLVDLPPELGKLSGLTQLDLASNQLTSLPREACRGLTSLATLNLMANQLAELPDNFGDMRALRLIGLKSNKLVSLPDSFSRLTGLVELFLTDNRLETLPDGMSRCTSLVKLQASFNAFTAVPACLLHLPRLELLRVAVCAIATLPPGGALLDGGALPRLAWFSVAGNPVCPQPPRPDPSMPLVEAKELELGQKLGDGASGEVFRAVWRGQLVAVKFFRADVSPDGRTEDEVALAVGLQHPHLTQVLARVREPHGLVLRLETGKPLALKPTSQHLLRCKWADEVRFSPRRALVLARSVADALRYCHHQGVCHGDVYAHNVLMDEDEAVTLCDFGASYSYDPQQQPFWQAMEVRAFGLMLRDVAERCLEEPAVGQAGQQVARGPSVAAALRTLAKQCAELPPKQRPSFQQVCEALKGL